MEMITPKDRVFGLTTFRYKITHTIKTPTRITDYDYGDGERYISTYIHTLEFRDKITESKIYEVSFPSDVCAQIISVLYKIVITNDSNIQSIIIPDNVNSGFHIWYAPGPNISITVTDKNNVIAVFWFNGSEEINGLIDLLDVDEMEEMFVSPSE